MLLQKENPITVTFIFKWDAFYEEVHPTLSKPMDYFKNDKERRNKVCKEVENYAKKYAEGIRVEAEARLGKLIRALLEEQRIDLVQLVSTDAEAREKYYDIYNIE